MLEPIESRIENVVEVVQRLVTRRQVKVPARVVSDTGRVVPAVGVLEHWSCGLATIATPAQTPVLHEPADVTDFPEHRIDAREARHTPLIVVEVIDQRPRILARLPQRALQLVPFQRPHGSCA